MCCNDISPRAQNNNVCICLVRSTESVITLLFYHDFRKSVCIQHNTRFLLAIGLSFNASGIIIIISFIFYSSCWMFCVVFGSNEEKNPLPIQLNCTIYNKAKKEHKASNIIQNIAKPNNQCFGPFKIYKDRICDGPKIKILKNKT